MIPYLLLGWFMQVSGGALFLFAFVIFVWQMKSQQTIFPRAAGGGQLLRPVEAIGCLGFLLFAFARHARSLGRRLKTAPVVIPGSKKSVLYLRAFDDEFRAFAVGPRSKLGDYTNRLDTHMPTRFSLGSKDPTIGLTLEDFLEEAITARICPFVGLGNPADRLPPDGAVREYAPDAEWKQRFLDLAQSARCIVTALGESDNLQWELKRHAATPPGNQTAP